LRRRNHKPTSANTDQNRAAIALQRRFKNDNPKKILDNPKKKICFSVQADEVQSDLN